VIHLDTSFLIRALVRRTPEEGQLRSWLRHGESCAISAVAWTEFLRGPISDVDPGLASQVLGEPVPFSGESAGLAAQLFNLTGRRRGSLMDCMIAAVALSAAASLATSNPRDFTPFRSAGRAVLGP
jgi:predicted nucleic acid-binding protein